MGNSTATKPGNATLYGFRQNDKRVLRTVYVTVFPKVKTYVLKNNGNEADAKDLYQEAFVACWKNIKDNKLKDEASANVEGYLFTIAKNKWMDHLRSSTYKKTIKENKIIQLHPDTDVETAQEQNPLNGQEKMLAMRKAFQQLGPDCQTVLNLFYFERRSMEDIAKKMNIGSASARNKKYRCMEKLRLLAKDYKNDG